MRNLKTITKKEEVKFKRDDFFKLPEYSDYIDVITVFTDGSKLYSKREIEEIIADFKKQEVTR